jgi:soluble lytic murein transglycosylase-like protein
MTSSAVLLAALGATSVGLTAPQARAEMALPHAAQALPQDNSQEVSFSVLSSEDAQRYRRIFALQDKGRWSEADRQIKALSNPILMGHVLYQRYMHPTAWHAKAAELQAWMASYHDLPNAETIHTLAQKRGARGLQRATWNGMTGSGGASDDRGGVHGLAGDYSSGGARAHAGAVWGQVERALRRGYSLTAKRILVKAKAEGTLATVDYDRLSGQLAYTYFIDGQDSDALEWATPAIERSGERAPMALWAGGLTAWRTGQMTQAAHWFEVLGQSEGNSEWMTAAGAYWAARAALRDRQPERAGPFLVRAAAHPRTFYGLLARRALGLSSRIQWDGQSLSDQDITALQADKAGQRALALMQLGRTDDAEQELRGLYRRANENQRDAIIHAADLSGMSGLAIYLSALRSRQAERDDDSNALAGAIEAARYPVPTWQPEDGWRLDRALIFAFVRQESAFNPSAKSYAGARGLMQVMPATAAYIAGESRYRHHAGRNELLSPELNLALGQKYLEHLFSLNEVDGNLFYAAAAYNAGPGNLRKWKDRLASYDNAAKTGDDPLLFIESIPIRETRVYVERVMANLWMYRDRMGQTAPSLDMAASGDWPKYVSQDQVGVASLDP